jgi:3-oxoacyl-[acyl-carrier protein] reductase
LRVQDLVVIVTGAGRGIGRAIATRFAAEGAQVAILDRDEAPAEAVAAAIRAAGGAALGVPCDITDRAACRAAIAAVVAHFGGVDVLINNAGVTADARLDSLDEEDFDRVVDTNLKGAFNLTQAALPPLRASGRGRILNTASTVGIHGNFGQTNYAAAKGGLIAMTKTWARELGREGITVNAVAPGFIRTEMTASVPAKVIASAEARASLGRIGTPEDVTGAFLFLASDDARYVTGQVLIVDGGLS